jgi:hypothetical protein
MVIFVKTLDGRTLSLDVEPSATIRQLKEAIRDKEQIPVENQRIIFAGKMLNNSRTIRSFKFQQEGNPTLIIANRSGRGAVPALSPNLITPNKIINFKEILKDNRANSIIKNKIIQYARNKGITNLNKAIEGYTNYELQKQIDAAEISGGSKRKPAKRKPAKRKPAKRKPTGKKKVRKIHKGPRGGKYYISKGRKVYI